MTEVDNAPLVPVVCVLGAWSSGTTAVTGYLTRVGGYSCPPHVQTNDPRTPNSHEPVDFAIELRKVIGGLTLKQHGDREAFCNWLRSWLNERSIEARASGASHIVLKHPLSAYLIKEINAVCNPDFLVVTRPFIKIEETRKRRKWYPSYGAAGAQKLYSTIFSSLIEIEASYSTVSFRDFTTSLPRRRTILKALGISGTHAQCHAAESWLK
ncbi:hypothetical protein BD293_4218 [Roseinatronobacter monicus]|uniref:Sulfotransferase family protein n=1 Tax=Roseinatronobacter monicus TaxID=393481 RepID=A0A543K4F1_9RHOB|nr:hypothetical protein BD293_4218 [Roseinatronobacter monicus]